MQSDLFDNVEFRLGFAPVVVTDNTAQVTGIIDTQGFDSLAFGVLTGTLADTDATFAVSMEHGDDSGLSDTAAAPAANLDGTTTGASFTFASDSKTHAIGYRGSKRYVRLTVTPSGNTGNAPLACMVVLGHPALAPKSTQIV